MVVVESIHFLKTYNNDNKENLSENNITEQYKYINILTINIPDGLNTH